MPQKTSVGDAYALEAGDRSRAQGVALRLLGRLVVQDTLALRFERAFLGFDCEECLLLGQPLEAG